MFLVLKTEGSPRNAVIQTCHAYNLFRQTYEKGGISYLPNEENMTMRKKFKTILELRSHRIARELSPGITLRGFTETYV